MEDHSLTDRVSLADGLYAVCDYTSDGSADWTPEIKLKCQEKTCNEPESIPNGAYMKSSSYHVGHQINYSCIEGYVLQGTGIRTCSDNQQWSGSLPSCEVFVETCSCDFFTKDVNETSLRIKGKCTELVTDQEHIPLECEEGYSLMQGPNEAICLGGKWKLLGRSRCQKMCSCDLLKQALLSSVRLKENCNDRIDDGKLIRMECKEGYSSNRKERSAVCDNGEWIMPFKLVCEDLTEINDPLIQPITSEECDPFATNCFEDIECLFEKPDYVRVTLNGKLQKDRSFNVADGAVLIMRCENITQYYFYGDNKLKCKKGHWIGKIPSCTRLRERERFGIPVIKYQVEKREAVIDIDGSLQVTTGEILKLSCLYFKSYSNIAKWSYRNLVDSQISFKPEWNMYQDAFEINLSPVKKYHETEYTCCMNEKLCNSIRIKVIELQCEEPPLPVNGFIRGSVSLSIDSEIEYACDRKYLLEGGTKSKCILLQGSLKWSHPPPRCNEKLCENPTVPENGYIKRVSNKRIKGTVHFGCQQGYDLVGEETATCIWVLNKIQWSKDPPKCIKISEKCKRAKEDDATYFQGRYPIYQQLFEHQSKLTVKCKKGSEISVDQSSIYTKTEAQTECNDGSWQPDVTCIPARCFCSTFPSDWFRNGRFEPYKCSQFHRDGDKISLTCPDKYPYSENVGNLECQRGIWKYDSKLECTLYPCSIETLRDNELKIEIALQHRTIKPSTVYGFQWKSSEHRNFEKEYAVPDGSEISLNCKFPKRELFIDDEFRGAELKLKCNNGEIVPDVYWECRPKRCHCNSFLRNIKFNRLSFMKKCNGLVNHGEEREVKCKDGFSSIKQKDWALCKEGDWILDDFVCKEKQSTFKETNRDITTEKKETTVTTPSLLEKDLNFISENDMKMNTIGSSISASSIPSTVPSLVTKKNIPFTQTTIAEDCDPFEVNCFEDIECLFNKPDYVIVTLDGEIQKDSTFKAADGAILMMRCENITQYYFSGDSTLKCNKSQWSGKIPICTRLVERERYGIPVIKYHVQSGNAQINVDGSVQVTAGENFKLSCLYYKVYSNSAEWNYRNLDESKNDFTPKWSINHDAYEVNLTPIKKVHEGKYTCCMNKQLCNSIQIKVIELQCEKPPSPDNGFIRGILRLAVDSEIEYGCDIKYLPVGGTKSKCILYQGSLKWSHPPPRCTEKLCENPTVPENGFIRKVTHKGINGTVHFGCQQGYDLVGEETATCNWVLNKIQWSKDPPKCVKIYGNRCSELNTRNSQITYNSKKEGIWPYRGYNHRSTATVLCTDGYEISPVKELITPTILVECSDGKWLPEVTCTEARCSCKEIPHEMKERKLKFKNCNSKVDSRTSNLLIECQEGFTAAVNEQLAHCERGIWTISRLTRQTECEQVSDKCRLDLSNANNLIATYTNISFFRSFSDFDEGSVIKFRCDQLNKLQGNKNSTCHNGRWSSEIPKCISTSTTNPELPPLVDFRIGDYSCRTFTDDGRIVLPKNHLVDIYCWSIFNRQLTVEVDRISGKFIKVQNELQYYHTTTTKISSEQTAEATVKCSTAGNFHIFDVIFSDICLLPESDLNQRGFRVVPKSKQILYVEGDEIEVELTSTPYSKKRLKCMGSSNNSGRFVDV